MAKSDGSVLIDTKMDTSGFRTGATNISSQFDKMAVAAKRVGAAIAAAFAVKKIVSFGAECIELGSDLQEVQNVVDTVFTTMSDKVDRFAQSAAATYGLSETMAKRYIGTYGSMAKAFGFTEKQALDMSTTLTGLAGDIASFYNISQDEAYTKLKSVFSGETETLKDLGIVMTQSALDAYALAHGYGKTTSAMTEMEKVALRYAFVQEQLTSASGDFAKTADSWANQTRILKLQIDSIKASLGQGLINVFTPVIKLVNTLLGKIATLANAFKALTETLTGRKSSGGTNSTIANTVDDSDVSTLQDAADATQDIADANTGAADTAKKAAKETKRYLSGLDEIRKYETDKDTSSTPTTSKTPSTKKSTPLGDSVDFGNLAEGENKLKDVDNAMSGLAKRAKELAELFKKGFQIGFGDSKQRIEEIKGHLESIRSTLSEIWNDPEVRRAASQWADSVAVTLGTVAGSMASVGVTIATNLVGGVDLYLQKNKDFIKRRIVEIFDVSTELNQVIADIAVTFQDIFSVFGGENAQRITSDIIGIFANTFMGIVELSLKCSRDVLNNILKPFKENKELIKQTIDDTLGVIADAFDAIQEHVNSAIEKIQTLYDEHVKPLLDSIGDGLSEIFDTVLTGYNQYVLPVIEKLEQKLEDFMNGSGGELFDKVMQFLGDTCELLQNLWETILVPLFTFIASIVMPILGTLVDIIGTTFFMALTLVSDALGLIVDILDAFVTGISNAITWIGNFASTAQEKFENVKENAGQLLSDAKDYVIEHAKGMCEGAVQKWEELKTAAGEKFESISTTIKDYMSDAKKNAGTTIKNFVTDAKTKFNDLKSKAVSHFDTIKSHFVDAFKGGADTAKRAFDNLATKLKTPVNAVIRLLNGVIGGVEKMYNGIANALNSLHVDIPWWVPKIGGQSLSFHIAPFSAPRIPYLATGAVIPPNKEFLAVLGDQKSGTNIEAPADLIEQIVGRKMMEIMDKYSGNGNASFQFVAQLDRRTLFSEFVSEAKLRQMQTGKNPLTNL